MNDLVKRSDVIAILRENGWLDDTPLEELVNEVPTAYNVEKVVEEIKKEIPLYTSKTVGIVEKGGVDYKGLNTKKKEPICNKNTEEIVRYLENHGMVDDEVKDACIYAIQKVEKFEALDSKLREVYGENESLLETAVNGLIKYEKAPSKKPDKSLLLTDEDVDNWYKYKEMYQKSNRSHPLELPKGTFLSEISVDGEDLWALKNPETNQMSIAFTKEDAIKRYKEGQTIDTNEWEDELENEYL